MDRWARSPWRSCIPASTATTVSTYSRYVSAPTDRSRPMASVTPELDVLPPPRGRPARRRRRRRRPSRRHPADGPRRRARRPSATSWTCSARSACAGTPAWRAASSASSATSPGDPEDAVVAALAGHRRASCPAIRAILDRAPRRAPRRRDGRRPADLDRQGARLLAVMAGRAARAGRRRAPDRRAAREPRPRRPGGRRRGPRRRRRTRPPRAACWSGCAAACSSGSEPGPRA